MLDRGSRSYHNRNHGEATVYDVLYIQNLKIIYRLIRRAKLCTRYLKIDTVSQFRNGLIIFSNSLKMNFVFIWIRLKPTGHIYG